MQTLHIVRTTVSRGWSRGRDRRAARGRTRHPAGAGALDAQSRDNDALDVKALGLVAVDAAIFALLAVVHHDALNRYWAIPAAAIIGGGLLLVASVFRQAVDAGPNWRTFFERFGGLPNP